MRFSSSRVPASLSVALRHRALGDDEGNRFRVGSVLHPVPTIDSVAVSGNTAVVSHTIPSAPEVGGEQFEAFLVALTPTRWRPASLWIGTTPGTTRRATPVQGLASLKIRIQAPTTSNSKRQFQVPG